MIEKIILLIALCLVFGNYYAPAQNVQSGGNTQQENRLDNVPISNPVNVTIQSDPEQMEADKRYRERQEQRDESNAAWNRGNVILNVLLFGVVVFQGFMIWRQYQAGERSLQVSNRAYVTVEKTNLLHPVAVGKKNIAHIVLGNKGNTPAVALHTWANMAFAEPTHPETLEQIFKEENEIKSSAVIAKDGSMFLGCESFDCVDKEAIDNFRNGKTVLHLWGTIEYKDLFGQSHKTKFYFYQRFGEGVNFSVSPTNNEVD